MFPSDSNYERDNLMLCCFFAERKTIRTISFSYFESLFLLISRSLSTQQTVCPFFFNGTTKCCNFLMR